MASDTLQQFLLDDLDILGTVVRLGPAWREMIDRRRYPPTVIQLLGELTVTTLLLSGKLKQVGRLTIQLRGDGAVSLLLIDCDEQLRFRGMARFAPAAQSGTTAELLGDGQLMLSLDLPSQREPYQSLVPLVGNRVSEVFEHFVSQSEQLASRVFLAASEEGVGGLLLQKLPTADERDADGWRRIETLAATVQASELLTLNGEELLGRLFAEGRVRLFAPRTVAHHCPEDWEKVRALLRALGAAEAYAVLQEQGVIVIQDEICNREYRFDTPSVDAVFGNSSTAGTRTLH